MPLTPDPRSEVNKLHLESHRRALQELSREELETFALIEYGLTMFYSTIAGEDVPDVGNLVYYGMDYDWLLKATDEIINKTIMRAGEIAEEIKGGN